MKDNFLFIVMMIAASLFIVAMTPLAIKIGLWLV